MAHRMCRLAVALLGLVSFPALAAFHTWVIERIYSNADGSLQFVVLHESQGVDGENHLDGRTLRSTHAGVPTTYVFEGDLPGGGGGYYMMPSPTANRRMLVATQGVAMLGLVTPDYVIPDRFLPTDGGTLNFAGVDEVALAALPTDGVNAVLRDGTLVPATATNFAGRVAIIPVMPITVVEYYHAALDHYFISALAPDIVALDSGQLSGWTRTGKSFRAFASVAGGGAGSSPVCRFYIPPPLGDSHFLSASPAECDATRAKFPQLSYESANVFYIGLPDTTSGACPAGTLPVYRVWNNRADSNHRYTTDRALRDQMVALGYIAEGYGPDQVGMCAPQ